MIELNLSAATAFAIVGSVVTIVVGLFGYMSKARTNKTVAETSEETASVLENLRVECKERVHKIELAITKLEEQLKRTDHVFGEHERRDYVDFKNVNKKIDKLSELILQMLRDRPN